MTNGNAISNSILTLMTFIALNLVSLSVCSTPDKNVNQIIKDLNQNLIDQKIHLPAGDNALLHLNKLITINDGSLNKVINESKLKISRSFLVMATRTMERDNYSLAALHIAKAKLLTPNLPEIKTVEKDMRVKQKKLSRSFEINPNSIEENINNKSQSTSQKPQEKKAISQKSHIKTNIKTPTKKQLSKKQFSPSKGKQKPSAQKSKPLALKKKDDRKEITKTNKVKSNTTSPSIIKKYVLDTELLKARSAEIKSMMADISKDIINKNASIIIKTKDIQTYRWLTVRLMVETHKISKDFKLRHQYNVPSNLEASIELIPFREKALVSNY